MACEWEMACREHVNRSLSVGRKRENNNDNNKIRNGSRSSRNQSFDQMNDE